MHECLAYQIRRGHLLHVDGDVEEVLDVDEYLDDEGFTIIEVQTRNATSSSQNTYTLARHQAVFVE